MTDMGYSLFFPSWDLRVIIILKAKHYNIEVLSLEFTMYWSHLRNPWIGYKNFISFGNLITNVTMHVPYTHPEKHVGTIKRTAKQSATIQRASHTCVRVCVCMYASVYLKLSSLWKTQKTKQRPVYVSNSRAPFDVNAVITYITGQGFEVNTECRQKQRALTYEGQYQQCTAIKWPTLNNTEDLIAHWIGNCFVWDIRRPRSVNINNIIIILRIWLFAVYMRDCKKLWTGGLIMNQTQQTQIQKTQTSARTHTHTHARTLISLLEGCPYRSGSWTFFL